MREDSIEDLRSFINVLEQHNELIRVKKPVDIKFELASVARISEIEGGPSLLFVNVKGHKFNVVSGLFSTVDRVALALNISKEQLVNKIIFAMNNPVKPHFVKSGLVKEVVVNEEINLTKILPIPVHSEKDGGQYISAGVVIGKDPETGRQNLSYNRMQVKGPSKLGINIARWRHLRQFYDRAEAMEKPLEIAICIGLDPAIELAAAARVPYDEIEMAGALRRKPLELVRCETVDIEVPSNSEIVIEGRIPPKVREEEGPFAEFTGYYGRGIHPIVQVSCITHREKPIYRTIVGASLEHVALGNIITRDPLLYQAVKQVVPTVRAVHHPPHCSGFQAIISIEKRNEGESKNAILAAFASHVNLRHVIVVDEDVDVYNPKDVEWAIATRLRGKENMFTIPRALGLHGEETKVGVDATVPIDKRSMFERVKVWNKEKIKLKDYL